MTVRFEVFLDGKYDSTHPTALQAKMYVYEQVTETKLTKMNEYSKVKIEKVIINGEKERILIWSKSNGKLGGGGLEKWYVPTKGH